MTDLAVSIRAFHAILLFAGLLVAQSGKALPGASQRSASSLLPWSKIELSDCDKEWFEPKHLQKLVDKLCPMIERRSGLTFKAPPVVRVLGSKSWLRVVRREMPNTLDVDRSAAITLGLYIPEREEILLSPYVGNALMRSSGETVAERHRFALPTLAHELVHVLQEQHFQLPSRMRSAASRDDANKLKFLIEGHATLMEERISEGELGLPGYAKWSRKRHLKARRITYTRGRDYLHNLEEHGGMQAIHDALKGPLPSWPAFVRVAMRKRKPAGPTKPEGPAKSKGPVKPVVQPKQPTGNGK